MPIAVGNGSRVAQVSGNRRTKLEEPAPYALVGNIQTSLRKKILHIPIAQSEPGIEPNGASNDFRWKAVTFEGDGVHPKRLHRNHQVAVRSLNVTMPFQDTYGGGQFDAFAFKISEDFHSYFAQVANGAGVGSEGVINNPSIGNWLSGSLQFTDDNAAPADFNLTTSGGQNVVVSGNTVDFTLPPLGSLTLTSDGQGPVIVGAGKLRTNGLAGGVIRFYPLRNRHNRRRREPGLRRIHRPGPQDCNWSQYRYSDRQRG